MENVEEKIRLVVATLALVGIAALGVANYPTVRSQLSPWYDPIVSRDEVAVALWADANLPPRALYAADLFACEMLTATARAICAVGGAWELADNANQRFSENERAFLSNSSEEAWQVFRKYEARYVLTSPRTAFYAYGYKPPSNQKFGDARYFQLVHQAGEAKLYKVV